jgi:hypothetical protein
MLTGATFVSEEVKVWIQAAIEKLNYQPNAISWPPWRMADRAYVHFKSSLL